MSFFDGELETDDDVAIIKVDDGEGEEKDKAKDKAEAKAKAEKQEGLSPPMKALAKTMLGLMKKAMSDAGIESPDMSKALSTMGKLMDDEYPAPTSKAAKQKEKGEEDKEKGKGKKEAAGHDEEEDEGKPFGGKGKTEKSEDTVFKMMTDGSIVISGEVTKGRRMTAGRVEKIVQMFGQMAVLLKEADPEVFKKAIDAIQKGDLPRDPEVPSMVRPTGPKVTKSASEVEADEKVVSALESVSKRLEKIEKTRSGTSSVDGDGGTDEAKSKIEKSQEFWAGVLH